MITSEQLKDGKWQLSVLTQNGWIRHIFENYNDLLKYETKCYNDPMFDVVVIHGS